MRSKLVCLTAQCHKVVSQSAGAQLMLKSEGELAGKREGKQKKKDRK